MPSYKLHFTVPPEFLPDIKIAIFATGAGTYPGNLYQKVSFERPGIGYFTPCLGANPAIGAIGKEEMVDEVQVEILCGGEEVAREAVKALKRYVELILALPK